MTLRTRLRRLEAAARRAAPAAGPERLTDEGWLAQFEAFGREGDFAAEPDFPAALAAYRDALGQDRSRGDPPLDPPSDFLPHLARDARARLLAWQDRRRPPEVEAAWCRLAEMVERGIEGIPPVTEAEFADLAAWFYANEERLGSLSQPTQLLELGGGQVTSLANVRYGLWQGPGASDAWKLAERVRQLKAHYGGEAAVLGQEK